MLIIQYNYGRGYKSTVASLETAINIRAGIICLQEPFIRNKNITYSAFNFYLPGGSKTEARVLTAVKKKLANRIIVENQLNLVDHLYFLALDIQKIDSQSKRLVKGTKVANIYNN